VADSLFSLVDGAVTRLLPTDVLPPELLPSVLDHTMEQVLDGSAVTVATWEADDHHDRPDVLFLESTGTLVVVITDASERDTAARIHAVEEWLSSLGLRDIGYLSDDPLRFYEQLWDLSPENLLALSGRRYVVIGVEGAPISETTLPSDATVEFWSINAYRSEDQLVFTGPRKTSASAAPVIDLVPPSQGVPAERPTIRQGALFRTDRLPLLFDQYAVDLTPISDQLFAAGNNLVMVDTLPDAEANPFPAPDRYEWRGDSVGLKQLAFHAYGADGTARATHLFIEPHEKSEFAMYVGELTSHEDADTVFTITPPLSLELFRELHRGQLPQQSFATTSELSATTDWSS